jgi:signal transduction histidine kinase
MPKAVRGVLDLRDWNFAESSAGVNDGIVKLDGEWEFYWEEFLSLEEMDRHQQDKISYIKVPSSWSDSRNNLNTTYDNHGFATYRLKVLTGGKEKLNLNLPTIFTSYELFINSKKILSMGKIGKSKESMLPIRKVATIEIPIEEKEINIILHIANFHHRRGGLVRQITLGSEKEITFTNKRNTMLEIFSAGVIFIIGFYHYYISYLRPVDKVSFWFACMCTSMFIRCFSTESYLLGNLSSILTFNSILKLDYLGYFPASIFFTLYIRNLLNYFNFLKFENLIIIIAIMNTILALITFSNFNTYLILISYLVIFVTCLNLIFRLIYNIRLYFKKYLILYISFLIMSITIINDILYDINFIKTLYLTHIGFLIFILAQSFMIITELMRGYNYSEILSGELEQKVTERTEELNQKKQLAEKALSDLQEAQSQLIEAERMASLGQLVGGVAHEINNPIGVIRSNSELIAGNLDSILQKVPSFLESLSQNQKDIFYVMVTQSIQNKEFLTTKEERARKKEIKKEIDELLVENKENLEYLTEQILLLRLKSPYNYYINHLGESKFIESLEIAQIFVKQSQSISNIETAIEKVTRVVFALRSYLNTDLFLESKEVDLVMEIDKSIHLYDNYIIGKVTIYKDYQKEMKFRCTPENISQVWKHLIFNAVQSMYLTEKKLEVHIKKVSLLPQELKSMHSSALVEEIDSSQNSWILVSFIDSGHGIPEIQQSKIFTPFFTTKALGEGIGLGLYVSKKIVHEHGGRIYFSSREGRTEFVVLLPVN